MSPSHASPRWGHIARTAAAMALAIPLVVSAAAEATWTNVAPAKDHHCGASIRAPHAPPLWIQSCVIVHDQPSGAYVQGAVKVSSADANPRRLARPTGYTRVWLDGRSYRNDNCGEIVVAGRQTMWCYGKTTLILGHDRDVHATGYVWFGAGPHDGVDSPHRRISPSFPAAWSTGPVDASSWRPALRRHTSIMCGDRSIPANLPPQSVSRGWTARTQAIANIARGPAFGWTNVGGSATGTGRGHVSDSFHYCGRAIDGFAPGVRFGRPATGAGLSASWRLANWAAHNAPALNVSQVIFYDRIWTARGGGWHPYRHPTGSGTTRQHRDHVHISVY